jgi:hypothetical protein
VIIFISGRSEVIQMTANREGAGLITRLLLFLTPTAAKSKYQHFSTLTWHFFDSDVDYLLQEKSPDVVKVSLPTLAMRVQFPQRAFFLFYLFDFSTFFNFNLTSFWLNRIFITLWAVVGACMSSMWLPIAFYFIAVLNTCREVKIPAFFQL